jgi:hypothetical protein
MVKDYIRVGLGFQIGRQVAPKVPAFYVLQSFLGTRPPLPFQVYKGGSHGLAQVDPETFNADVLAFVRS